MRYEYKIKVDADMFGWNRNGEDPLDAEGVVVQLKRDFARVLNPYAKSHVFFNIQVKAVPHDNDRDYTEEDAEKHLNGEPEKKRKTYAEDFFEKFPNAPFVRVGILDPHDVPAVHFWDVYGIDAMKKYVENPLMVMGDSIVMQAASNELWLKEKPEDADA